MPTPIGEILVTRIIWISNPVALAGTVTVCIAFVMVVYFLLRRRRNNNQRTGGRTNG